MSKEEPDAKDAAAAAAPKGGGGGGMMPLILMVVLMPAISYAMMQFVFLPKIRGIAAETQVAHAAEEGKGGHKTEHKAEAKTEHKAEAKHGKGKHGKEGDSKSAFSYDFENVVVNLAGTMGTRYLKTNFTAEGSNADLRTAIEENKKQLLDVASTVLGTRTLADLEQPGAKNVIRNDLIANFNQTLKSDLIERIFFSEFVVQ
jgi:flagellar FliL protein